MLERIMTGAAQVRVAENVPKLAELSYLLGEQAQNTKDITALPLANEHAIAAWLVNTSTATKRAAAVARSVDPDLAAYFAKESKSSTEVSAQLQAQVKTLLSTDEEKAMFTTIGTLRQRYLDEREAIMKLKASGKNDAARAMFDETFDGHTIDYVDHLKQMLTMQERAIDGQPSISVTTQTVRAGAAHCTKACRDGKGSFVPCMAHRTVMTTRIPLSASRTGASLTLLSVTSVGGSRALMR